MQNVRRGYRSLLKLYVDLCFVDDVPIPLLSKWNEACNPEAGLAVPKSRDDDKALEGALSPRKHFTGEAQLQPLLDHRSFPRETPFSSAPK